MRMRLVLQVRGLLEAVGKLAEVRELRGNIGDGGPQGGVDEGVNAERGS